MKLSFYSIREVIGALQVSLYKVAVKKPQDVLRYLLEGLLPLFFSFLDLQVVLWPQMHNIVALH